MSDVPAGLVLFVGAALVPFSIVDLLGWDTPTVFARQLSHKADVAPVCGKGREAAQIWEFVWQNCRLRPD